MLEFERKGWIYRVCRFTLPPKIVIIPASRFQCVQGALGRFWHKDVVNQGNKAKTKNLKEPSLAEGSAI